MSMPLPLRRLSRKSARLTRHSSQYSCERLETRRLLSSIVWTNKGQDSDGFFSVFGFNAGLARTVVAAAISSWQRVISNFNYSDGSDTYSLTVSMAASGISNGANAGPSHYNNGKPDQGGMTIGRGSDTDGALDGTGNPIGNGGGYYLDSNPFDLSKFESNSSSAFGGYAGAGSPALNQADLYEVVLHELGHAMGLLPSTQMLAKSTDTGVKDLVDSSQVKQPNGTFQTVTAGDFWLFNGADVQKLMTGFDSGGQSGVPFDGKGPQHAAPPGSSATVNGVTYVGADDLMTPFYTSSQRRIISDGDALMLKDAYGYSIALPSSFGTYYDTLDASGALRINTPGNGNSTVSVSTNGSSLTVTLGLGSPVAGIDPASIVSSFTLSQVSSIQIATHGGNDTVYWGNGSLTSLPNATITMGFGNNTLVVNDSANIAVTNYEIFSTQINRQNYFLGVAQFDSTVSNVTFYPGTGSNDAVNVYSTNAATSIQSSNTSTINIGNNGSVQAIKGALTLTNPPTHSSINIDDSQDSTGKSAVLTDHGITGLCAAISWVAADVNGITITGGYGLLGITVNGTDPVFSGAQNIINAGPGNDYVDIEQMTNPLTVNTQTGTDPVFVGASGNLDSIQGALTLNGNSNSTLTLQDYLNPYYVVPTTDTFTASAFARVTYAFVGGQVIPHSLSIANTGFGNVALNAGANYNTVDVESDSSPTTINAGTGTLVVLVSQGAENLDNVPAAVTVNGNGTDPVDIEDQNNASLVVTQNTLTGTTLTRFAENYIFPLGVPTLVIHIATINYSNVGGVQFDAGSLTNTYDVQGTPVAIPVTLNAGIGQSVVSVTATSGPLTINGQNGADAVTLGPAGYVQGILGTVTIGNVSGQTSLLVDDSADTAGRNVTITNSAITGLAPGAINYAASTATTGIKPLTVKTGMGPDTINIASTDGTAGLILSTGGSNDTINVGSTTLTLLPGALSVDGGAGIDTITVNDPSTSSGLAYTVTSTTVTTGIAFAGLTYTNAESLMLNLGSGQNTVIVNSTNSTTPVTVYAGTGTDTINVNQTDPAAPVTIAPSAGNDVVKVNFNGVGVATAVFAATQTIGALSIGNSGKVTLAPFANNTLTASSVSIGTTGRMDLNNNALVVPYTGTSPLTTLRGYITTGFNFGAWNGYGIASSVVAAYPLASAIGYLDNGSQVTVRATWKGDANADGKINADDLSLMLLGQAQHKTDWPSGNFNYDAKIDADDWSLFSYAVAYSAGKTYTTVFASLPPSSQIFTDLLASPFNIS